MLKIWKGPEMEGADLDETTLFICSDKLLNFDMIYSILKDNKDITKIYLGAGRTKFHGFDKDAEFVDYCCKNNIKISVEVESTDINSLDILYIIACEIILCIRIASLVTIDVFKDLKLKLDDYHTARVYSNQLYFDTDLSTVKDNKYDCDIMLYEEE